MTEDGAIARYGLPPSEADLLAQSVLTQMTKTIPIVLHMGIGLRCKSPASL